MAMISGVYTTLKCNLKVTHQEEYDDHAEAVHGVAPKQLTSISTIKVDTKQPFTLDPALHIEHTSND